MAIWSVVEEKKLPQFLRTLKVSVCLLSRIYITFTIANNIRILFTTNFCTNSHFKTTAKKGLVKQGINTIFMVLFQSWSCLVSEATMQHHHDYLLSFRFWFYNPDPCSTLNWIKGSVSLTWKTSSWETSYLAEVSLNNLQVNVFGNFFKFQTQTEKSIFEYPKSRNVIGRPLLWKTTWRRLNFNHDSQIEFKRGWVKYFFDTHSTTVYQMPSYLDWKLNATTNFIHRNSPF